MISRERNSRSAIRNKSSAIEAFYSLRIRKATRRRWRSERKMPFEIGPKFAEGMFAYAQAEGDSCALQTVHKVVMPCRLPGTGEQSSSQEPDPEAHGRDAVPTCPAD